MNPRPEPARLPPEPDPLTAWTHATLRSLPPPSAPATLAGRVLAELARRERLPWWRRDFACWPRAARWTFLTIAAGGAGCSAAALTGGSHWLDAMLSRVAAAASPLASVAQSLLEGILTLPTAWLQGLGFAVATSLTVLLALVTALARVVVSRS
jgi:hypothetical protein